MYQSLNPGLRSFGFGGIASRKLAMAQAMHGSAPDIAGRDFAIFGQRRVTSNETRTPP